MTKRTERIIGRIKFRVLYLAIQVKISLLGSIFVRKNLKNIFSFLILLVLVSPGIPSAQTVRWPWVPKGENFQLTGNSGNDFNPSVTSNDKFYFVVWSRKTANGFDIYGIRIDKDGNRMPRIDQDGNAMEETEIPICTTPKDQMFPSAVWNGENFFVVWQDFRNGFRWDIYGARVTPEGQVLAQDQNGIRITQGKLNYDQVGPVVSFDGEDQLVVWQSRRNGRIWNLYFTKVSKDGAVFAKQTPLNSNLKDQTSPAVVFDDQNYFIVWQDKRSGKSWDIYGAGLAPSGDLLNWTQTPVQITDTQGYDRWNPVAAWNGSYYLVVWTNPDGKGGSSLSGRRISADGSVLDISDVVLESGDSNKAFPSLLWDGKDFLVVWEEEPEGKSKIYGVSIQSGYYPTINDIVPLSDPEKTVNPTSPTLAKLGEEVLVVWQEGPSPDNGWNIFGQIISRRDPSAPNGFEGPGGRQ